MPTFTASTAATNDDAKQQSDQSMTLNGTSCLLNAADQFAGMRFLNVTIPPGSTITAATLLLRCNSDSSDAAYAFIHCHDTDDAAAFSSSSNDIGSRALTSAYTSWAVADLGVAPTGTNITTPDFAAAVQEVIDRPGWSSGNDLAVIFDAQTSCNLQFAMYDHATDAAPALSITYTPPGGGAAARALHRYRLAGQS